MRRLASTLLAMLVLGLAFPAFADDADDDEPLIDRFYLTVGAGQSLHEFDEPAGVEFDDAPGANARIGFEVFPILDAEIEYEFGGRFDDEKAEVRVNIHALTGNLKIRPLVAADPDSVIQPYASVGFGWLRADLTSPGDDEIDDGWAVRGALGIEVPIDTYLSVYTEASYVFGGADVDDYQHAHIGAGLVIRLESGGY